MVNLPTFCPECGCIHKIVPNTDVPTESVCIPDNQKSEMSELSDTRVPLCRTPLLV